MTVNLAGNNAEIAARLRDVVSLRRIGKVSLLRSGSRIPAGLLVSPILVILRRREFVLQNRSCRVGVNREKLGRSFRARSHRFRMP